MNMISTKYLKRLNTQSRMGVLFPIISSLPSLWRQQQPLDERKLRHHHTRKFKILLSVMSFFIYLFGVGVVKNVKGISIVKYYVSIFCVLWLLLLILRRIIIY